MPLLEVTKNKFSLHTNNGFCYIFIYRFFRIDQNLSRIGYVMQKMQAQTRDCELYNQRRLEIS